MGKVEPYGRLQCVVSQWVLPFFLMLAFWIEALISSAHVNTEKGRLTEILHDDTLGKG